MTSPFLTTTSAQYGTAVHRGAEDYLAGRHLNPYDYEAQGDLFRGWVEGYQCAKNLTNNPLHQHTESD